MQRIHQTPVRAFQLRRNRQRHKGEERQQILMVEAHAAAVANIDDIASVEGVDGIFLGPSDLSTSMGYLAAPGQPEVQAAIRTVESAAKRHGKFLSTISSGGEDMRRKFDLGYSLLYLFSDTTGLAAAAQAHLKEAREYIGQCGKPAACGSKISAG